MRLEIVATIVLFSTLGVGCATSQRAVIAPAFAAVVVDVAPPREATKLVYRAPASRLHVHASDLLNGDHSIVFGTFRGVAELDASGHGRFRLNVDMQTLEAENDFITGFAKYELLEVDTYPRSTLVARVEPIAGEPGVLWISGNLELHGVKQGIQFRARYAKDGDGLRIHAVWLMSRTQFGMRAREADWIIQDDLRITLDLRAAPERVTIEDLP